MSLRRVVAAPFRHHGRETIDESEFKVAVTIDRTWYSPDQAERLLDVAESEGLVRRIDDGVTITYDFDGVELPEGFVPDESLLRTRSRFERVLDATVEAGVDKQEAVANVNRLQTQLGISIEAAALLYARRQGVDVSDHARAVADDLLGAER